MTRLLAAATGRGSLPIHLFFAMPFFLVLASFLDPAAHMRTSAFATTVVIIAALDLAVCQVWRIARIWARQFLENR